MWKLQRDESLRASQLADFDADNNLCARRNIFGLPFSEASAAVVILPVPWEVSVSYREGTAQAPASIHRQSHQLDLFDLHYGNLWQEGISMRPIPGGLWHQSDTLRQKVRDYQAFLEGHREMAAVEVNRLLDEVNQASQDMVDWVQQQTEAIWSAGKIPGLVGGDHSTPLGAMRCLRQYHPGATLLQIDAHADLRIAFEGFVHSHASIMHNALDGGKAAGFGKLVQVGIRDLCETEYQRIQQDARIVCFGDDFLQQQAFAGTTWQEQCKDILGYCGPEVYISLDIDGLEAAFAPATGTPVPGGLHYNQVTYLLRQLGISGKRIIGFDLCEVGCGKDEWDAIVGARMLYQLCLSSLAAQKK